MVRGFIGWLVRQLKGLGYKGSLSLENIGFAITATTLVGVVVVVTGNTIVMDTEEKAHVMNAQALGSAVEMMIGEQNSGPSFNTNKTFTLKELYAADKIGPARDASKSGGELYNADETKVLVQNVADTLSPSSNRAINKIFVKLVSADGYIYTDQTDTSVAVSNRIEAKDLGRDNILIPRRNADGF